MMSRQAAIDLAMCVVQQSDQFHVEMYRLDGPHDAEVIYEWANDGGLAASWRVTLAPPVGSSGLGREAFSIGPNGEFRRSMISSHGPEFVMPPACVQN